MTVKRSTDGFWGSDFIVKKQKQFDKKKAREEKLGRPQKNKAPEKEVVAEMLLEFRKLGFSLNVVESKAVFSKSAGRYLNSQAIPGMSDIVGSDPDGRAVYIEVKAPGKRSTVRESQVIFLKEKIRTNCFAIVADSAKLAMEYYENFVVLDRTKRPSYLLSLLPKSDSF